MRSLLGGSLSVLLSTASRAAAQFLLLWLIARTGGPHNVGSYATALAVSTPLFVVSEGGLRSIVVSRPMAPSFHHAIRFRITSVIVAALASLSLASLLGIPLIEIALPLTALKTADAILDVPVAFLLRLGENFKAATFGIANSVLTVSFAGVATLIGDSPGELLWSSFAGSAVSLLLATGTFVLLSQKKGGEGLPSLLERASLGCAAGMSSLIVYTPVLYMSHFASETSVGVYAAAAQGVTIANLILSSLQQGALPWLAPKYSSPASARDSARSSQWTAAAKLMIGAGAIMGLLLALCLPMFVRLIYGEQFAISTFDAIPIGLSVLFLSLGYVSGAGLLLAGKYFHQFFTSAAVLAGLALGSWVLAPTASILVGTLLACLGYALRAALGWAAWQHAQTHARSRSKS